MISYDIYRSQSDLLSMIISRSMLLETAKFYSSLWLSTIPLCVCKHVCIYVYIYICTINIYTMSSLSVHLLMDTWVASVYNLLKSVSLGSGFGVIARD